ncbi:hypothetical protein GU254_09960 [Vibrio cholerae]|nr:hypothetical protein [Vibrio cholerae]MBN7279082.1 hypothetical protein [Vibrio paracholerae]MCX9532409.1 hypothetical protein [Vibrio cholerae]PUA69988.1 hypothetical protein DB317_17695 [Vibrio cholerae]RNE81028.1 hypothetical protein EEJ35_17420 [Vibrio cholerae]
MAFDVCLFDAFA